MNPLRRSDVRSGFARTDDGQELYWRTVGSGPTVALCNGIGVSTFFWKYVVEGLRDRYRVVLWDYRGHGRSTVPRGEGIALGMERNAADLWTVLDAAGVQPGPAVLVGHSMGCQVILEAHRQAPERVRALVPMFGTFARPLDTFFDSPHARAVFDRIQPVASRADRRARRWLLPLYASPVAFDFSRWLGLVHPEHADAVDIHRYTDHLVRMDPDVFLGMLSEMAEHDLGAHLPHVGVPTLVFGAGRDVFTPAHRARAMADAIPGARYVHLEDASHAALVEHPLTVQTALDAFLAEVEGSGPL